MPLIPFEPFRQLDSLRDEMNRWMNHNFPSWAQQTFSFGPRVDVSETDAEVIVEAEIPGLTKEDDINIEAHPTQVVISGEIRRNRGELPQAQTREQGQDRTDTTEASPVPERANYYHTERYVGQFRRVISLPAEVDETSAEAQYENGVLEIRIPKIEKNKGRRLDVRFH